MNEETALNHSARKIRVALECRIEDPRQGIGSAILSLAHALSQSSIEDQEYTFIVHEGQRAWLEPHIFGPCKIAAIAKPKRSMVRQALGRVAPLQRAWIRLRAQRAIVPASDGFVENGEFDLVHFTTQTAYLTRLASIYQPWDLQHLHYPQFFSKTDFAVRESWYRAFCKEAKYVCVQTEWSKQDILHHFGLDPGKVVVIRWGSVFDAYTPPSAEQLREASEKFGLAQQFFIYPAITWPHKNHEDILRALGILKQKHGRSIDVCLSGRSTEYRRTLDQLAGELQISAQVHHLGFVTPVELQALFSLATAMLFPSRFEGFGLPILEAFHARLPVVCSDASVLPEVAGDAALYFTPGDPEQLAERMMEVLDNPELCKSLVAKGTRVLSTFSIHETAKNFQRLYDRMVGSSREIHAETGQELPANSRSARELVN